MVREFEVYTPDMGLVNISSQISEAVKSIGIQEGICLIFVPHTTAGLTINEGVDPSVAADILAGLDELVPRLPYSHAEGNSPAHIKASLIGASVTVPVTDGELYLGPWQGIFLCEFDGPRLRSVRVNCVGA
ncbi:MAG: hypothetical protein H6Q73_1956 [Firmicutes bacterium]|nr:hypothetical protein [Bacillota bacterium]